VNGEPVWDAWEVRYHPTRRLALIGLIAEMSPTSWYWADAQLGDDPWIEVGTSTADRTGPGLAQSIAIAHEAGMIVSARRHHAPLMFDPRLFPHEACPESWGRLLADTSQRAVSVLRTGGVIGTPEHLAHEIALIYRSLVPHERWRYAAAWHSQWLCGPSFTRSESLPSSTDNGFPDPQVEEIFLPCATEDFTRWAARLGSVPTPTGLEPAWLPTVTRLAHIQAVRLTADGTHALECVALALMRAW
jgi:hypothetical protein